MTPEEFVKEFYIERSSLIEASFKKGMGYDVAELISSLNLKEEDELKLKQILNAILRDALYTILLGLDGEAKIGNRQEVYKLSDEDGNELTGGELEVYAWEYFHNNKMETDER